MVNVKLIGERTAAAIRILPAWRMWLLAVLMGLLGGVAALVAHPLFLICGLVGMAGLLTVAIKGYRFFWAYLLFLLAGYLFLGKGFAYVGVSPVYVAEIGLALAAASLLVALLSGKLMSIAPLFRLEVVLLLVFVVWQAARTIPYLGIYGVDAVRDAAVWGYAAFAIFIFLLIPRELVDKLFIAYGRLLPYYLAWLLVAWVLVKINPVGIGFPGSPVPLLHLKSGEAGVHLAGAAAFLLLRLDLRVDRWSDAKLWFVWGLWLANWLAWGATNRGGMFTALVGIVIIVLWRPRSQWYRPVALALVLFTLFFTANVGTSVEGHKTVVISAEQIAANMTSTFGGESATALEGTRKWRMEWWGTIVDYTFGGEYFWSGKGYGVNLANEDRFQVTANESLRSPHNVFMTILARSGVPGFILWLMFLTTFCLTLVRKASTRGDTSHWSAKYALWLLAYWLACLVNGSFDVFLEGPMGGVPFWCLVGFSLVYFARSPRLTKTGQDTYGLLANQGNVNLVKAR